MTSPNGKPRALAGFRALVRGPVHRPAVPAAALLTVTIVAGLVAVQCGNPPAANPVVALAPQLCLPGATPPSDRFAFAHGCITYSDGSAIWAVDPNHPGNRISLGPSHGLRPIVWSRDGSRLLLMGQTAAGVDLYVMNADGSQTRLTSHGMGGDGSLSPNGAKVVFTSWDGGLYVVDAKGGTPRLIARSYPAWWLGTPTWSPDGSRIAYTVYLEGAPGGSTVEIWTTNPDGSDPRQLVDLGKGRSGACTGCLAWSPDGSLLAFGFARGIYTVHADGSGLHRLNVGGQPSWSPDGSRIAFTRVTSGQTPVVLWGLFTMSPDGSHVTSMADVGVVSPDGWTWNPVA